MHNFLGTKNTKTKCQHFKYENNLLVMLLINHLVQEVLQAADSNSAYGLRGIFVY